MQKTIEASKLELKESIVNIRRVAKTVKGGRNMRFSVTVVVGDGEGHVGVGLGKAREIPEAVRKAIEDAKKNLIKVPMVGTTIPHRNLGVFGAGRVLLMPGAPGTGVIAGSSVRTVLELSGIRDIRAKSIGSNNAGNMAYATIEGLKGLKTIEEVSKLRGKTKAEILGLSGVETKTVKENKPATDEEDSNKEQIEAQIPAAAVSEPETEVAGEAAKEVEPVVEEIKSVTSDDADSEETMDIAEEIEELETAEEAEEIVTAEEDDNGEN